ncbi:MAG TPA: acyltransferase [Prolixibacteraceae bacterium]
MDNGAPFFAFIHLLRGMAALLVLWAHLGCWYVGTNHIATPLFSGWFEFVVKPFHLYQEGGHLGVLIFLLISGFVITHVSMNESVKEFVLKRLFRIVPTLAVAFVVMRIAVYLSLFFNLALPLGNEGANKVVDYVYNFFLLNWLFQKPVILSVTWTLFIEVVFYIITAIFISSTKKTPLRTTWHFLCLLSVVVMIAPVSPILKNIADFAVFVIYILIGRIIYLKESDRIGQFDAIILGIACFTTFILLYDYLYPSKLLYYPYSPLVSDILAIVIFGLAMSLCNGLTKIVAFFAEISYALYLLHLPVGCLVMNFLMNRGYKFEGALIVAIMSTILLSFVINRIVEIPAQRFVRKLIVYIK